jgi:hypothetical protein
MPHVHIGPIDPRRRARTGLRIALLALAMTLALEGTATAGCGNAKHASPTRRIAGSRAPLIIGDSVVLGAVAQIAAEGFEVDTRGCRQISEGLGILASRKRAKTLPHFVVLALGTNGYIRAGDIREALRILGPDRILGLVTPRELGGGESSDARAIRAAGRRFPDRIRVLDWVRFSAGEGGWFAGDGIHLGPSGARGLARLLREALPLAVAPLCP